jgi:hypothetical protein
LLYQIFSKERTHRAPSSSEYLNYCNFPLKDSLGAKPLKYSISCSISDFAEQWNMA